ncbi:MAG: D-alanyl-D-alanine carboxypeptidase family protein [Halothiobacillaceae bacterium]
MQNTFRRVLTATALSFSLVAYAGASIAAPTPTPNPVPTLPTPAPMTQPLPSAPTLASKSYVLMDFNSGQFLVEQNPDMRVEPASITKLMTAYIIYAAMRRGELTPETMVNISEKAWKMGGSKMFVRVGTQVSVDNLLKGLIIQSGNDATVALAEHVAGSEEAFVAMMNHEAQRLGLSGTHFANSTGWPDANHYSTARDVAHLMAAVIRDFPEGYKRESEKEFVWNNIKQINRNRLLWRDPSVDGGKTGHTESAGFCLAASAQREGMRLISVVLGANSDAARAEQTAVLLNYGFRFFETRLVRKAGDVLDQPRIWKGAEKTAKLGINQDFYVTTQRGKFEQLNLALDITPNLTAPLAQGQIVGALRAKLGDKQENEAPVVVLVAVPEGGFIRRMMDSAILMFKK